MTTTFALEKPGSELNKIEKLCLQVFNLRLKREVLSLHQILKKLLITLHRSCVYSDEELKFGPSLAMTKNIISLKENLNILYLWFVGDIDDLESKIFSNRDSTTYGT